MLELDQKISAAVAGLNGLYPHFDRFMLTLSANSLLKGGVITAFLWFAWFAEMGRPDRVRSQAKDDRLAILAVLVSCAGAEIVARMMSLYLPFRPRPLFDTSLPFQLPEGVSIESLNIATESSFPSDHAVLFFALATALWAISHRAAVASLIWVTVAIAFPRLYLGLHYFSDLVVGAALGMATAAVGMKILPHLQVLKTAVLRSRTHPAYFYPLFFLAMHQLANMLVDVRNLGAMVKSML